MTGTTYISITDEQLVLLDGLVDGELAEKVAEAKHRLAFAAEHPELGEGIAAIVAGAVAEANTNKLLVWQSLLIDRCRSCGKGGGYVPYKSGYRKGEPNLAKPRKVRGVELARRFVSMANTATVGGCRECVDVAAPFIAEALAGVEAEIPEILTGHAPKFRRLAVYACKCGWTGNSDEVDSHLSPAHREIRERLPSFSGNGNRERMCPGCDSVKHRRVEMVPGEYVVVPVDPEA